jgi:hypothetical protein
MTPKPDTEPVATLVERLTARAKSEQEGGSEAAAERAMMGMEAKSDLWAERVNLNDLIGNIVNVGRLDRSAPDAVREKFIKRQFELIDALMRQAFLEGYLEGGLSRKAYDDELDTATASALLALEGERDALREALKPFAREAELWVTDGMDCQDVDGALFKDTRDETLVTLGDFRRARAALSSSEHI